MAEHSLKTYQNRGAPASITLVGPSFEHGKTISANQTQWANNIPCETAYLEGFAAAIKLISNHK